MHEARDAGCHTPIVEWDRWSSRALRDACFYKCIVRRVLVFHKDREQFTPTTRRLQHRLGDQARRRRTILEQSQMRVDYFRAPEPRPVRPGQIERADPQRTGDGAHEHRAIARDSKTTQGRRIIRLSAMQPGDPETRAIWRDRNASRAPPFRQSNSRPHPDAARMQEQRARGHPRLASRTQVRRRKGRFL